MMDFNRDLMDAVVQAKQEELRASHEQRLPSTEVGKVRRVVGTSLIRIGERLRGTPTRTSSGHKLAFP